MFLCIGPTPALQRVMVFSKLTLDAVNRATTTVDGAAGKSVNVAKILKFLGEWPLAAGFVGGESGEHLLTLLRAKGIESDFVKVTPPTRQCITVIDESAATITELVEESRPVSTDDYELLTQIIRRRIENCRAVIISGTMTPGGPPEFYRQCTQLAHESRAITILDAHGPPLAHALEAKPDVVKPNRAELAAMSKQRLQSEPDVIAGMRGLHDRGAQRVIITAGKEPTLAFDGRSVWRIRSGPTRALNPIGSGDAFTAALAWRLTRGDELGEACRWGAAAGAANALTLLPGELEPKELERLAREVEIEQIPE